MSRQRSSRAPLITDDEINDLILRLQLLLPQLNQRQNTRAQVTRVLREACRHIKKLHREVDNLSERLCQLLDSMDTNITANDAELIRSFLQQQELL